MRNSAPAPVAPAAVVAWPKARPPHRRKSKDPRRLCGVRAPTPHPTSQLHSRKLVRQRLQGSLLGGATSALVRRKGPPLLQRRRLRFLPFIVQKIIGEPHSTYMAITAQDGKHREPHRALGSRDEERARAIWQLRRAREAELRRRPCLKRDAMADKKL